jgi:hypothetical protein
MLRNKFILLFLVGVVITMNFSCVSANNELFVDSDWRLVSIWQVSDPSTGWSTNKEVAAGNGHSIDIDESHKFHPLVISVTYRGEPHPKFHQIVINYWDGSNINLYSRLAYNWHCYYN